jgi:hypothetical protein
MEERIKELEESVDCIFWLLLDIIEWLDPINQAGVWRLINKRWLDLNKYSKYDKKNI